MIQTTIQAVQMATIQKTSADLDELEKELGLDSDILNSAWPLSASTSSSGAQTPHFSSTDLRSSNNNSSDMSSSRGDSSAADAKPAIESATPRTQQAGCISVGWYVFYLVD